MKDNILYSWISSNATQESLKKVLTSIEEAFKQVKKEDDPAFIASEWKRLMQFNKGIK